MKARKTALVAILVLFISCIGYIAIDCIRLSTAEPGAKPLITISVYEESGLVEYKGLGYSVTYHYGDVMYLDGTVVEEKHIYGMDIWLLDSILLWGWIE